MRFVFARRFAPWQASILGLLVAAPASLGQTEVRRFTSFATLDIEAPRISGEIWLPAEVFEAIHQIDRDGDFEYSQNELNDGRGAVEAYLRDTLFVLWGGEIQPVRVSTIAPARRPRSETAYIKARFRVRDYPPGRPVSIVCRVLRDVSRTARCVATITQGRRREVFAFGPGRYYESQRPRTEIPRHSPFRPPHQRGRVASFHDIAVEMLYALPAGEFRVYFLESDRYTPHGLDAKTVTAQIRPKSGGEPRKVTFTPRPLPADKDGTCSRFVARIPEMKAHKAFSADIAVTSGPNKGRLIFDFPAVEIQTEAQRAAAGRRYACPDLCLGVQSKRKAGTCPRCQAVLIPLNGENVPGYGVIGPHGGQLRPFRDPRPWAEALLASPREFRLYLANADLTTVPVGRLSGTVHLSTDARFQQTVVEMTFRPSGDGRYLTAEVPETVVLPVRARCVLDEHDDRGPAQIDFFLSEITKAK